MAQAGESLGAGGGSAMGGPAGGPVAAGGATEALLRCWLMVALGVLLLGVGLWDFRQGQEYGFLRVAVLVAEMAAGVGIGFCFGGAMHYGDAALGAGGAGRWYGRGLLVAQRRVLMVGQMAAAGIIVMALGAVVFNKQIPGPDYSVLERSWTPAGTGP